MIPFPNHHPPPPIIPAQNQFLQVGMTKLAPHRQPRHHHQHLQQYQHQILTQPLTGSGRSPTPPEYPTMERKYKKPIMEKKRRARLNKSFDRLKEILLHSDLQQTSKLEKADVMEKTIKYLEELQRQNAQLQHQLRQTIGTDTGGAFQNGVGQSLSVCLSSVVDTVRCLPPPFASNDLCNALLQGIHAKTVAAFPHLLQQPQQKALAKKCATTTPPSQNIPPRQSPAPMTLPTVSSPQHIARKQTANGSMPPTLFPAAGLPPPPFFTPALLATFSQLAAKGIHPPAFQPGAFLPFGFPPAQQSQVGQQQQLTVTPDNSHQEETTSATQHQSPLDGRSSTESDDDVKEKPSDETIVDVESVGDLVGGNTTKGGAETDDSGICCVSPNASSTADAYTVPRDEASGVGPIKSAKTSSNKKALWRPGLPY